MGPCSGTISDLHLALKKILHDIPCGVNEFAWLNVMVHMVCYFTLFF